MQLENLSRVELKALAKARGLKDYVQLSKPQLIRLLNPIELREEEKTKDKVAAVLKQPLSPQALKWKSKLKKLNITPENYLLRYPDHLQKVFIQELI